MTIITINETKTKDEILNYLKEYNLIPKKYENISVESEYFVSFEKGTHELLISITNEGETLQYNYLINHIDNEKVVINNNIGPLFLSITIFLLLGMIFCTVLLTRKFIIKRKNKSKDK